MFEAPDEISSLLTNTDDDLLFFVPYPAKGVHPRAENESVFARRKGNTVPVDLAWGSELAKQTDWQASLLLNIVLLTEFRLTVARCTSSELPNILNGTLLENFLGDRSKYVVRKVHPSPVKMPMTHDNSRSKTHHEPEVSYPNICFTVDDFDEAFQDMTLEEPTDCYAIALHAMDSWGKALEGRDCNNPGKVANLAFNGYANCRQVETVVRERTGVMTVLRTAKIVFNGPGGIGQAEAIVTVLCEGPARSNLGEVPRYIRMISKAVFSAFDVHNGRETKNDDSCGTLRCALTSLCVPVDSLIWDILNPL